MNKDYFFDGILNCNNDCNKCAKKETECIENWNNWSNNKMATIDYEQDQFKQQCFRTLENGICKGQILDRQRMYSEVSLLFQTEQEETDLNWWALRMWIRRN